MKGFYLFFIGISNLLIAGNGFSQTPAKPPTAPATPTFKLFLIGDAGEGDTTGATLYDLSVKLKNYNHDVCLPRNGSPGPVSLDFNDGKTRIIFVDSYRLIIEEGRKRHQDTVLLNAFYKDLKDQLTDASDKHEKIIVVAHHPIH